MIFNNESSAIDYGPIKENKYGFGLNAALMAVYENECNYNAMMKAVGLSEMRYALDHDGASLFVNEAGAFGNFIEKAKAFFKKVIEKIKSIFHKFMATINSFAMKDKDFVKKYEKELLRKDVTDLEFTGYEKFKSGECVVPDFSFTAPSGSFTVTDQDALTYKDSDAVQDRIEANRSAILGKSGGMSESEFREELHDMLYGDKETYDVTTSMVRNALTTIRDTSSSIKKVEKDQKDTIKSIEKFIKDLDSALNTYNKAADARIKADTSDSVSKKVDTTTKNINNRIDIYKAMSNDRTIAFGMTCQAIKDCNRQCKALCVKVISYNKKESAQYESATNPDDIFAGVKLV